MLLRVHMLGNGAVGQAAFNKRHRWMFSDAHFGGQIPLGSIENQDLFQDNSDIHCQFSSGIETIAVISVEPHGVVQFGSTNKHLYLSFVHSPVKAQDQPVTLEFLLTTRLLACADSRDDAICGSDETNICTLPTLETYGKNFYFNRPSKAIPIQFVSSNDELFECGNQLHMVSTSTPLKLSNESNTWLQEPLAHSTCFTPSGAPSPCISTWSSGQSTLTSIEQQLPSQSRLLGDCIAALKKPFPVDNFSPQILSSPEQRNSTVAVEVSSVSSSLNEADVFGNIPFNHPSNTVQSSVTNTFTSSAIENDLFESLGVDIDFIQAEGFLDDILMPGGSGGVLDFGADTSECISEQRVNTARPEESVKVGRKKARPGSRPKPKDRQQIQDRIAELRKLIPNGLKMSIDTLLAQTIKHMLFLQSVTNHAENLKQAEERKVNEPVLSENSCSSGYNVMWATEVGAQTMVDPVDVKDLRIPGQKLIQMLCEEKGFFLEIVDIIQGFGLTILKGVMEVRKDKIWHALLSRPSATTIQISKSKARKPWKCEVNEEEKAREKSALEAAEKEAALARMHQVKALSVRPEPEYRADVTQVKCPFCL
ncbi:hypothetical protein C3L33_08468, partial [Rhododendron williamsianum]